MNSVISSLVVCQRRDDVVNESFPDVLKRFDLRSVSTLAMEIFAKATAILVPMAVPHICR